MWGQLALKLCCVTDACGFSVTSVQAAFRAVTQAAISFSEAKLPDFSFDTQMTEASQVTLFWGVRRKEIL